MFFSVDLGSTTSKSSPTKINNLGTTFVKPNALQTTAKNVRSYKDDLKDGFLNTIKDIGSSVWSEIPKIVETNNQASQKALEQQMAFNAAQTAQANAMTERLYNQSMEFNKSQVEEANRLSRESAKEQNEFNAEQARIAREWEKMLSDTAYQREVEDLRKAGLNPILALMHGGASTPSTSAVVSASPQIYQASSSSASGQAASASTYTGNNDWSQVLLGLIGAVADSINSSNSAKMLGDLIKRGDNGPYYKSSSGHKHIGTGGSFARLVY